DQDAQSPVKSHSAQRIQLLCSGNALQTCPASNRINIYKHSKSRTPFILHCLHALETRGLLYARWR
ncbi:hypothetical protein PLEOSDRAFT_23227, partial [Pleurotus ostreatus PC15]